MQSPGSPAVFARLDVHSDGASENSVAPRRTQAAASMARLADRADDLDAPTEQAVPSRVQEPHGGE